MLSVISVAKPLQVTHEGFEDRVWVLSHELLSSSSSCVLFSFIKISTSSIYSLKTSIHKPTRSNNVTTLHKVYMISYFTIKAQV